MSYFFPVEFALPLFLIAVVAFIFRLRGLAKGCFLLAVLVLVYRPVKEFLLIFLPLWLALLLGTIALLAALRVILSFIFGKAAIDNFIGQLLATGFTGVFKVGLQVLKPFKLVMLPQGLFKATKGSHLNRAGEEQDGMGGAGIDIQGLESPTQGKVEICDGKVLLADADHYFIELSNGEVGLIPIKDGEEEMKTGEQVDCRVIRQLDSGILELTIVKNR